MKAYSSILACVMFLGGGVSSAHTPAQKPTPPTAPSLILEVDFKLNAGAASTKQRLVTLDFTARLKNSGPGQDLTSTVHHYRVLESPTLFVADLSAQPWIPLSKHPEVHQLALRNGQGERYGERRVMFQVKTDTLTSDVVSDTITLEPVLKEYRVSAGASGHPLVQYAAGQGFQFPRDNPGCHSNRDSTECASRRTCSMQICPDNPGFR